LEAQGKIEGNQAETIEDSQFVRRDNDFSNAQVPTAKVGRDAEDPWNAVDCRPPVVGDPTTWYVVRLSVNSQIIAQIMEEGRA